MGLRGSDGSTSGLNPLWLATPFQDVAQAPPLPLRSFVETAPELLLRYKPRAHSGLRLQSSARILHHQARFKQEKRQARKPAARNVSEPKGSALSMARLKLLHPKLSSQGSFKVVSSLMLH